MFQPFSSLKTWATVFHYSHKHLATLLTWTMVLCIQAVWTCTHARKYMYMYTQTQTGLPYRWDWVSLLFYVRACSDLQPRPRVQLHSLIGCLFYPFLYSTSRAKQTNSILTSIPSCPLLLLSNLLWRKAVRVWKKRGVTVRGYTALTDTAKIRVVQKLTGWNMHGFNNIYAFNTNGKICVLKQKINI